MMMKRKRMLSLLTAAGMCLANVPLMPAVLTASAADNSGTCGENVNWVYDEGTKTLTISGTGDMTDYYHESVPWVSWNKEIKTAVIEKGVTSIGESAFYDCIALTSVTIPDGVTTIGDHAFYFCKKLPSVVIPDSVTSVLQDAFYMCLELSDITLPDTLTRVGREAFDSTPWLKSCWAKSPFVTAGGMLIDAKTCTGAVTIPNSVTRIADYAFEPRGTNSKTESMTSVVIPDSVTEIGQGAFKNCDQLTKVTLPDSLTSLSGEMFGYCDRLNNIVIPDSVTEIKNGAFYYCEALDTITIPESVTSIGWSSLLETKWMSDRRAENPLVIVNNCLIDGKTCKGEVTIPDKVTSIAYGAFSDCKELSAVTIPETVESIGEYAFSWCSQELIIKGCTGSCAETYAKENKIPFESIGAATTTITTTTATTALTTTTAPAEELIYKGLKYTVGKNRIVITGYTKDLPVEYTIPDEIDGLPVREIAAGAFKNCTALKKLTLTDDIYPIGENAFAGCDNLTLMVPKNSYAADYAAQNSVPYQVIPDLVYQGMIYTVKDGEVTLTGFTDDIPAVLNIPAKIDGMPVTGIGQMAFYNCEKLKEVTIPDSIVSLGFQNFLNCKNLEKVTLPKTLKAIYESAFANCTALKSVTIPEGCETIGNLVFSGCTALSEVVIPATVTEFGEPAFGETAWLKAKRAENPLVIVNGILLDGVTASGDAVIPDGVKTIAAFAFSAGQNSVANNLTSVTIPKSVTAIGQCTFNGCEKLAKVSLPDTAVRIGRAAFDDTPWMKAKQAENPVVVACKSVISGAKAAGKVTVPDGVQYISMSAFENNETLTEITLPASVSLIDRFAFEDCKSLNLITILNPDCDISDVYESGDTICNGTDTAAWEKYYNGKIAGYNGSTAQAFAKKYGYTFASLGEAPQTTTAITTTTAAAATTTTKSTTTTAKATTTTAKATTTTTKATTTTAKATTTTVKATTTTAQATTTTAKATTTTAKATTTTTQATTITVKATTTTAKATTTTAQATTTTAKATTTTAPVTTAPPAETTPAVTTSAVPAPLRGDVTGDGIVSVEDAQLTLKAYTNRIAGNAMNLNDEQIKAADIDGNGEISVEDAQWILKYYTQKYVAGKDITWDDIFVKKTQALPRLSKK